MDISNSSQIYYTSISENAGLSKAYTTLCATLVAIILYELWFRNTHGFKKIKDIPGPTRYPLIGSAHIAFGLNNAQIMEVALKLYRKYGEIVSGCLCHKLFVFISNPADIEIILGSPVHLEKSEDYGFFKDWFGKGLLISIGDHWRHHRRMIAPTFHQSILKSFVPKFVKNSERVVADFDKLLGKEFDVHEHMSQVTVEILLSTVMGVKNMPSGKECAEYAQAVVEMCDIIHKRQINLLYRLNPLFKMTSLSEKTDRLMRKIHGLTRKVVNERYNNFSLEKDGIVDEQSDVDGNTMKIKQGLRDDLDDIDETDVGAKQRLAFLDAMVEMTKNSKIEWNLQDVFDEVNTIMFEGHDTTSALSSFVLCVLGIHKDIQQKVIDELSGIFADDYERPCTFNDTLHMNYLERVIKETLRLYPPVPIISRKLNEDVKLASKSYVLPKGTTVIIGPYATHRRTDIYENPEKFNPDNFLPEKVSKRHFYSYIPFSAGPRSCVGRKYAMLMVKILLSTILRKYKVHSPVDESQFKLQADIILKISNGFKIVLEKRVAS